MSVKLGNFEFDPVEPQDFRLAVEGASGSGKTNTLAVMLEDLHDTLIPTLVLDRVGNLQNIRMEDDNMIVVGGKNEKGIDLHVPIEQLDIISEMLFERNMKVTVAVTTYREPDRPTMQHKAVAKILSEINSKAREYYRTGNRKKILVVCDEVHQLAPEKGAPHISEVDKYVKRSRGQLINLMIEGGNRGINVIVAYQRRAYTSKGVVSQANNYIAHRLEKTDRDDMSREIGVPEEDIANLSNGEAFIYGNFTKQRAIGPTKIRKRTTPDPRDQHFKLPERKGDINETIKSIQEKLDTQETERKEKKNRIEKLENKLQKRTKELEQLKEDRDIQRKIARALSNLETGEVSTELKDELEELEDIREEKEHLEEKVGELNQTVKKANKKLSEKEEKIEDLKAEISDLKQLDMIKEDIVSDARSILRKLGAESPSEEEAREEINELQEELQDKKTRIDEYKEKIKSLRENKSKVTLSEDFENAMDFLEKDVVRSEIDKAMENVRNKKTHAYDTLYVLADQGESKIDDIEPLVDVSRHSISKIIPALKKHNIIKKRRSGKDTLYSIDETNLEEILKIKKKREKIKKKLKEKERE